MKNRCELVSPQIVKVGGEAKAERVVDNPLIVQLILLVTKDKLTDTLLEMIESITKVIDGTKEVGDMVDKLENAGIKPGTFVKTTWGQQQVVIGFKTAFVVIACPAKSSV